MVDKLEERAESTDARLARIEEKQDSMKDDISEMKQTSKETNTLIVAMSERFLTVDQAKEMREERDKKYDALDVRVRKLESWRNYIGGGLALAAFLVGIVLEGIRLLKG